MSAPAVALVGPPGAGKSTVGRALAEALQREFCDSDAMIESRSGRDIADIFALDGEPAFRGLERDVVTELAMRRGAICSLGGGAFDDARTRATWLRTGTCIYLDTPARVCAERAAAQPHARPLLAGDPLAKLRSLIVARGRGWRMAHIAVAGDRKTHDIVDELVPVLEARALLRAKGRTDTVLTERGPSAVHFRQGALELIEPALRAIGAGRGPILVVTQPALQTLAQSMVEHLSAPARVHVLPDSEKAKQSEVLETLYAACAELAMSRDGAIVALGGGTVGDVAGMCAATFKRGVRFIQVPSTLLSVVDAAVGGKVAINLAAGKNLAGAFYPAQMVLVDPELLSTLPEAEYRAGLAEVIKHGLLSDPGLLDIVARDKKLSANALARAVRVKARIVEEDPEDRGVRMTLNLGHTFAHAIEAEFGYRVRHGEAVAIGLAAALELSVRTAGLDPAVAARGIETIRAAKLPTKVNADGEALLKQMRNDKKASAKGLRFIVLRELGDARVRDDITDADVRHALASVVDESGLSA